MAAVSGKIIIGNTEYTILSCSYSIYQSTDSFGVPCDIPKGNTISLVLQTNGVNSSLLEWATQPKLKKDGKISYTTIEGSAGQTFDFFDGYCINYNESYSANATAVSDAVMVSITISAMKIVLNGSYNVVVPGFEQLGQSSGSSPSSAPQQSSQQSSGGVSSFIAD